MNKDVLIEVAERVLNRLLSESWNDGEGVNPSMIDREELLDFCKNSGDFLYIYNMPLSGWKVAAANTDEIQAEIVSDIYKASRVYPTNEMDHMLNSRENEMFHNVVMKIEGVPDGDYYVIYQKDKQ